MEKYTLAIFSLLIFASVSQQLLSARPSTELPLCNPTQQATPSGCWTACTNPEFSQCGDVFPAIYDPKFCAYTKDGRYISYTFSCQACQNVDVIAVRDGACSCDFIKCGNGQQCQNGQCVDLRPIDPIDPCAYTTCLPNTICQNGKCISLGKPCTQLCIEGFRCLNGTCVQDRTGPVSDLCQVIKCRQGYYCKNNQCIPQPGLCGVVVCAPELVCRNNQCVNPNIDWACANIRCNSAQGYQCRNGSCVRNCNAQRIPCRVPRPNQETCPNVVYIQAPTPTVCGVTYQGTQVGYPMQCEACKDTSIQYYYNRRCQELVGCERPRCTGDQDCQNGFSCQSGSCVNKCLTVKCSAGHHCFKGVCVQDVLVLLDSSKL